MGHAIATYHCARLSPKQGHWSLGGLSKKHSSNSRRKKPQIFGLQNAEPIFLH